MRFRPAQFALLILPAIGVGCAPTFVKQPVTAATTQISDPMSSQLEFWRQITSRPLICNDDAFHGLLLFLDGKDPNPDYAGRLAQLKQRKLIPGEFSAPGDEAVRRGTVAYAVVQGLHINGGWALTVLGPTPRYALRELMYMNLFPRSSPEQTFSGSDFVSIIGRAEDYQDGESAFIPAQTLPSQPPGD